jgi:predicted transcriptional regulator
LQAHTGENILSKTAISVRVDDLILADLRACSRKTGKTMTAMLESAISQWMVPTLADIDRERKARLNFQRDATE